MKKLSRLNKVMYVLNIVLTVLTFIAYLLPFLAPKLFPLLSVFTLLMPLMLILNFLFFIYWLVQLKRQMLLPGLILLLGITFISKWYRFSATVMPEEKEDFTLMSYNVRLFNLYEWLPAKDIPQQIEAFVKEHDPDVLCVQEYSQKANTGRHYSYKNKHFFKTEGKVEMAIFSRFPIVNTGDINLPATGNNIVFVDLKIKKDTIRVYSMHMQSIKISPDIHEKIDEEKSKMIFKRISEAFKKQQLQAEVFEKSKADCPYRMIICGDLNNSAFSYVYRSVKGKLNDAFEEAGSGLGKTYDYKYYPARIDYILADKDFEVKEFTTFNNFVNSDHFPVMTRLSLKKEETK
jgi:endonuclease/exonuclease/phosphatase family metal-dependent hydrolase